MESAPRSRRELRCRSQWYYSECKIAKCFRRGLAFLKDGVASNEFLVLEMEIVRGYIPRNTSEMPKLHTRRQLASMRRWVHHRLRRSLNGSHRARGRPIVSSAGGTFIRRSLVALVRRLTPGSTNGVLVAQLRTLGRTSTRRQPLSLRTAASKGRRDLSVVSVAPQTGQQTARGNVGEMDVLLGASEAPRIGPTGANGANGPGGAGPQRAVSSAATWTV